MTGAHISGAEYRVLEPYCSKPSVAYAALRVDSAFGDVIECRDRALILQARKAAVEPLIGSEAYTNALHNAFKSCSAAVAGYHAATERLLAELARIGPTDPAATGMAHDVIILAWRLSESERQSLLVRAIEAHPAVEAAVVQSLYRCVLEEFTLTAPGAQQELLRDLLPNGELRLCSRGEVVDRLHAAASAVWTPDPYLRALDAAELLEAWLAAKNQPDRLDRAERCYRLLELSLACITPELTPSTAVIHREAGVPFLVATHALFPGVKAAAAELKDPQLDFSLSHARATYNQGRLIGQIMDRLGRLDAIVDKQGREIASLTSAVAAVNVRVDALEERVTRVEEEVERLKKRMEAVERFLSRRMGADEKNALLQQVAPILLHDDWESGPLMRPRDFAMETSFVLKDGSDERIRDELVGRGGRFRPEELARWLQAEPPRPPPTNWGALTAEAEMVPLEVRRRGLGAPDRPLPGERVRELNRNAIASRVATYGAVAPLAEGNQLWSVKYFWFHGWNETAFPHGEGNHEGDWGCADLTVEVPFVANQGYDVAGATVVDAIIHEHGRPQRYPRDQLEFDQQRGRLRVYLERGTNEAHPRAGGASQREGLNLGLVDLRYPVIREHRGGGYEYDLRGAVLHLFDEELLRANLDVQLIVSYHGEWGEYDDDDFKSVPFVGQDVTNPPGPLDNAKFRDRAGVIDHRGQP